MIPALRRQALPQTLLSVLPFLLFFPSGLVFAGVVLYLVALAASGGYREKWQIAVQHPLFPPTMAMLAVTTIAAIMLDKSAPKFWSGFGHYQIYFFFLAFIAVGSGDWQQRGMKSFMAGGVVAAGLFYLKYFGLLPEARLFEAYHVYSGSNSILLGILLALAAGVLLFETVAGRAGRWRWLQAFMFVLVATAGLFFAPSRTGHLIFAVLCGTILLWQLRQSWKKGVGFLACVAVIIALAWQFSPYLRDRALHTAAAVQSVGKPGGGPPELRIELYEVAAGFVAQKPVFGHGIGQWLPMNRKYGKTADGKSMMTPHNDYLLYATELGFVGLAVLLWAWILQLWLAVRIGGRHGMWALILTLGLFIGGAFNAILRDADYGMAFMILLAIPLAGLCRRQASAVTSMVRSVEGVR